jgi:hypothetical protein
MNHALTGAFAAICAAGIPVWWWFLFRSARVREWFVPEAAWPAIQSVMPADAVLAKLTGYLALQLCRRRRPPVLAGVVFGAWAYATAYTIGWAVSVRAPLGGPASMAFALAGFGYILYEMVSPRVTRDR